MCIFTYDLLCECRFSYSVPNLCSSAAGMFKSLALALLQVPSLAATLRQIAERCLPLPRVPAAAVAAAAASDGATWRKIETVLQGLGGIAAEGAGLLRGP